MHLCNVAFIYLQTTLSGLATAMKAVVTILLFSSLMITAFAITGTSLFRVRLKGKEGKGGREPGEAMQPFCET